MPKDKIDIWMPLYVGDYLADTMHLTTEHHGAYLLILMAYWRNGGPLKDSKIRTITRLSKEKFDEFKSELQNFFDMESMPGFWVSKRSEKELQLSFSKKKKKSNNGKAGAASKWGTDNSTYNAKLKRSERLALARKIASHTKDEWNALKIVVPGCPKCGSGEDIVKDHIQPIYQGGSDGIDNIQPLCRRCNAAKGPESVDYRPDGWRKRMDDVLSKMPGKMPGKMPDEF